jgi:hypothetical protein
VLRSVLFEPIEFVTTKYRTRAKEPVELVVPLLKEMVPFTAHVEKGFTTGTQLRERPLCSMIVDKLYAEGHRTRRCPNKECEREQVKQIQDEWSLKGYPISLLHATDMLDDDCDEVWAKHTGLPYRSLCEHCGTKLVPVEDISRYTCGSGRHHGFNLCMGHIRVHTRAGGDPADAWLGEPSLCPYTKEDIIERDKVARSRVSKNRGMTQRNEERQKFRNSVWSTKEKKYVTQD